VAKLNVADSSQSNGTSARPWTVRRILTEWRQLGIVIALLATVLVFTALDHDFFSTYNFVNILLQSSITAILAIGMTFVIITAGIDLSIGSTLALSATVAG
jgi:ribose transport system permease protein